MINRDWKLTSVTQPVGTAFSHERAMLAGGVLTQWHNCWLGNAWKQTNVVEVQGLSNASEHLHSQQLWCRAQALGLLLQREQIDCRSQCTMQAAWVHY